MRHIAGYHQLEKLFEFDFTIVVLVHFVDHVAYIGVGGVLPEIVKHHLDFKLQIRHILALQIPYVHRH